MKLAAALLAFSVLGLPAARRLGGAPAPGPEAAAIERYLGEATFQGGWSRKYPLGAPKALRALGIDPSLDHGVAVDAWGRA
ncbi:MAG TPA: hypothetical protein VHV47_04170, partial [Opitutaceae bacterium]|nr:hypothetical protein [Opitutaceae bacterium]